MIQLPGVTVVAWLLGNATGSTAADLHGPRLETFLERLVDTPVRGLRLRGGGHGGGGCSPSGETLVREAHRPLAHARRDRRGRPDDHPAWLAAARGAVARLL